MEIKQPKQMGSGINLSTAMSWTWTSRPSFSHTKMHAEVAAAPPPHFPFFQYKGRVAVKVSSGAIYLGSKNQQLVRFCSVGSHSSVRRMSRRILSAAPQIVKFLLGSAGNGESNQPESFTSHEILEKLKRYGIAGILSYGLLNTAYYVTTFLVVWFYVAPAPGRMGYLAAVERFVKVMAMVWAGSQVTKLLRAGGALALAPLVDRALSWFTVKFNFESQGKAFMAIAGVCFLLAFLLFLVVTLLCA